MSTSDAGNGERQRILEMVQGGTVTPEEGERLLTSLEQRCRGSQRCPFCAEEIPAHVALCPECRTPLAALPAGTGARPAGGGFHGLTGLGKFLVCYTFLICGVVLLSSPLLFASVVVPGKLLAMLGLVSAFLICKGIRAGWVLSIIWAALQIVPIALNGIIFNRQILHLGVNWATNGSGVGFNIVGLILFILFIKAMPPPISLNRQVL